jgi:indolepyruvate ferredoxin oxidoreductase beta subunit
MECYKTTEKVLMVDDVSLADKAGNRKAQNMVLLGCLASAAHLPMGMDSLKESIREIFPEKLVKINLEAFDLGYQLFKKVIY